ncbi:MAG: hypothetical protein V3T17_16025, partial [Pseudomonadales bacterium]
MEMDDDLESIYQFLLPNWSVSCCSWCKENSILDKEVGSPDPFDTVDRYDARISQLTHYHEEGVMEEPLFLLPGVERFTLGEASHLAKSGAGAMALLCLIASGLQVLRTRIKDGLRKELLMNNVLSSSKMFESCCWRDRYRKERCGVH